MHRVYYKKQNKQHELSRYQISYRSLMVDFDVIQCICRSSIILLMQCGFDVNAVAFLFIFR